jgi:hypothetical protein
MASGDDPFEAFEAFAPPADPLADPAYDDHAGAGHLRRAGAALDAGDLDAALEQAAAARRVGVPAELGPHLAIIEGLARVRAREPRAAVEGLVAAWREYPDVAALPAVLGVARTTAGDTDGAARVLFSALLADDPDHTLVIHRRRLTALLGLLG